MVDNKSLELEAAYDQAVNELENNLESLKAMAANEVALALKFVGDSHMPIDAIDRLANKVAYTRAVARRVADARSAMVTYRFNR